MKLFLGAILILSVSFKEAYLEKKLDVEVLYESLCPDSLRFFKLQLYPNWKQLAPYVNLKLVPFGKSSSLEIGGDGFVERGEFVCQHGPSECKGNRIMSCALKTTTDQRLQVEYVNCFMEYFRKVRDDPNDFGEVCALQYGMNVNEIMNCYNTREGTVEQLRAEDVTLRISPKFIPTILYDGHFNQQLQDESLIDFKGVICRLIKDNYLVPAEKDYLTEAIHPMENTYNFVTKSVKYMA